MTYEAVFSVPLFLVAGSMPIAFCGEGGSGTDTGFYLPDDAFYIDKRNGRIVMEIQFCSTGRRS